MWRSGENALILCMKLENQVCSLELARKLKGLGAKQEGKYFWNEYWQWELQGEVKVKIVPNPSLTHLVQKDNRNSFEMENGGHKNYGYNCLHRPRTRRDVAQVDKARKRHYLADANVPERWDAVLGCRVYAMERCSQVRLLGCSCYQTWRYQSRRTGKDADLPS